MVALRSRHRLRGRPSVAAAPAAGQRNRRRDCAM